MESESAKKSQSQIKLWQLLALAGTVLGVASVYFYIRGSAAKDIQPEVSSEQWKTRFTEYADGETLDLMFLKFLYFIHSGFAPERAFDIVVNSQ